LGNLQRPCLKINIQKGWECISVVDFLPCTHKVLSLVSSTPKKERRREEGRKKGGKEGRKEGRGEGGREGDVSFW
jgi:ligand-binding sensor protein